MILEAKIKKGDFIIAIIKDSNGQVCEGVVKASTSRTIWVITPDGEKLCNRKLASLTAVLPSKAEFVKKARKELDLAS